jgi:hypothetical protein
MEYYCAEKDEKSCGALALELFMMGPAKLTEN